MTTRFPQSSTSVAWQIAPAYASLVNAVYWAAGPNSVHALYPGATSTVILSRAAFTGAGFDATTGTITGPATGTTVVSNYIQETTSLGITEYGPYVLGVGIIGDTNANIGAEVLIGHGFSIYKAGIQGSGYDLNFGVNNNQFLEHPAAINTGIPALHTISYRFNQTDAVASLRTWIDGTEYGNANPKFADPGITIPSAGSPLLLGGTQNTANFLNWESAFVMAGTATDAQMAAVTTNPAVLVQAAVAAATAITLTGPTAGTVGVASTNFTAGANGSITGTVVVTPSDSAGGGTFTPTTVSISSATPTGTFTYTPGSSGAKTISVTNNGSLTNPANITYTATASATNHARRSSNSIGTRTGSRSI